MLSLHWVRLCWATASVLFENESAKENVVSLKLKSDFCRNSDGSDILSQVNWADDLLIFHPSEPKTQERAETACSDAPSDTSSPLFGSFKIAHSSRNEPKH